MKKQFKLLISFIVMMAIMFIMQVKAQAKSYYIENMDIQATIQSNGNVEVEQTLEYSFNGNYNGIYVTIPTQFKNNEEIISSISDDIYNTQGVELQSVQLIENEQEVNYEKASKAYNGDGGVYTEETDSNGVYTLKIYKPSVNQNRTFKIKYILKNLCIKHNDVGELYYNFIGGEWQCTIKNLSINIWLPNNTGELKAWGHGPDNGKLEIVDNTHVRLKVSNVATGKYVAARVIFDRDNIASARKISNINAYDLIYNDEQKIAKISDAKQNYTKCIYIFALILIIYWIILLIKYEKDKKYQVINIDEDELFKKYNPMLAGCLQGSRDILSRDIIAVILNLIDKKYINLDIKNTLGTKGNYDYFISRVPEKESEMDEIEKYVYNWIFGTKDRVDLNYELEELPKKPDASVKFKQLNEMVQDKLNEKGANQKSVPTMLRIFNTILFFVAIFISINHIIYEGFEIYNNIDIIIMSLSYIIYIIPIAIIVLYLPILLIVAIRHKITKLMYKITGQKVVTTTVTIIAIFLVILVLTILFSNPGNRYLIADEILICIAMIIMLTDNLMLKNKVNMIEDYSKINALKDKIDNYTMMEDRDIEQVTLWGKYLSYAVSFGIANKIVKRIKDLYIDNDLLYLIYNSNINDYIISDYYYFYSVASLDRRFMKTYQNNISHMIESSISSGSSGSGGGFSGGGSFHGGGGRGGGGGAF